MPHPQNHEFIGGEILGKGGYGCVFRPQLACRVPAKNAEKNAASAGISKLMTTHYAEREFAEYQDFKDDLMSIKNYQKYFIVDNVELCFPENIPMKELKDSKKCDEILNISRQNSSSVIGPMQPTSTFDENAVSMKLNEDLKENKYSIINMPYGGISLFKWITTRPNFGYKDIVWVNRKLRDVMEHAIKPLNARGVYHNDIKTDNLLVDGDNVRIIDWGLSYRYDGKNTPHQLTKSLLLFNLPFSNIVFSIKNIPSLYNKIRADEITDPAHQIQNLKEIIREFIEDNGKGHFSYYVNVVFAAFFGNNSEDTFYTVVANYLQPIFYAPRRKFEHFMRVDYFKLADIYGLFTTYYDLLELKISPQTKFAIREFFVNYLWKNPISLNKKIIFKYMRIIESTFKKKTQRGRRRAAARAGGARNKTRRRRAGRI